MKLQADPSAIRRTRVTHLVENLEMGGLEKLLVEFARHADRSRFTLRFLTLGRRGRLGDEIAAQGWAVDSLNLKDGLRPSAVPILARWFRRHAVEVLHVHTSGPLLYGAVAARLSGVSRIVSTRHHGPDINNSPRAIKACAFVSNRIDRVVCVSDDGMSHALAEGIRPAKLVTIRNGIDLERFQPQGPKARGPAVIVARLNPEKDHETLIRAVAIAAESEPSFRLEIAGDGPCLDGLEAIVKTLRLTESIRFLGQVDNVAEVLGGASLLVLSSLKEGISLTILEAMAGGLPVVATRVGGNPEAVVDGVTGLLVPAGSPSELADALLRLWRDPELAREFGHAGRRRAELWFDVRTMLAKYESLYENPTGFIAGNHGFVPSSVASEALQSCEL